MCSKDLRFISVSVHRVTTSFLFNSKIVTLFYMPPLQVNGSPGKNATSLKSLYGIGLWISWISFITAKSDDLTAEQEMWPSRQGNELDLRDLGFISAKSLWSEILPRSVSVPYL